MDKFGMMKIVKSQKDLIKDILDMDFLKGAFVNKMIEV